jgi:Ras of Complex, Roc, domain of DAPkinase
MCLDVSVYARTCAGVCAYAYGLHMRVSTNWCVYSLRVRTCVCTWICSVVCSLTCSCVCSSALRSSDRSKVIFSCWDFAGQEIYYSSHQFFLTAERAVFLVVWDITTDPAQSRLHYWLHSIQAHAGPDVPIVVVATHQDALENHSQILQRLQEVRHDVCLQCFSVFHSPPVFGASLPPRTRTLTCILFALLNPLFGVRMCVYGCECESESMCMCMCMLYFSLSSFRYTHCFGHLPLFPSLTLTPCSLSISPLRLCTGESALSLRVPQHPCVLVGEHPRRHQRLFAEGSTGTDRRLSSTSRPGVSVGVEPVGEAHSTTAACASSLSQTTLSQLDGDDVVRAQTLPNGSRGFSGVRASLS